MFTLMQRRPPRTRRTPSRKLSTRRRNSVMSTVRKARRRAVASQVACATSVILICIGIAVTWSDVVAGLGLAVAVLAWLAPRSPRT